MCRNPASRDARCYLWQRGSLDRLPLDFGGGYHDPGLTQLQLIERLAMCSGGAADGIVLPRGQIYGYTDAAAAGNPRELRRVNVGLNSCTNFPRSR